MIQIWLFVLVRMYEIPKDALDRRGDLFLVGVTGFASCFRQQPRVLFANNSTKAPRHSMPYLTKLRLSLSRLAYLLKCSLRFLAFASSGASSTGVQELSSEPRADVVGDDGNSGHDGVSIPSWRNFNVSIVGVCEGQRAQLWSRE